MIIFWILVMGDLIIYLGMYINYFLSVTTTQTLVLISVWLDSFCHRDQ